MSTCVTCPTAMAAGAPSLHDHGTPPTQGVPPFSLKVSLPKPATQITVSTEPFAHDRDGAGLEIAATELSDDVRAPAPDLPGRRRRAGAAEAEAELGDARRQLGTFFGSSTHGWPLHVFDWSSGTPSSPSWSCPSRRPPAPSSRRTPPGARRSSTRRAAGPAPASGRADRPARRRTRYPRTRVAGRARRQRRAPSSTRRPRRGARTYSCCRWRPLDPVTAAHALEARRPRAGLRAFAAVSGIALQVDADQHRPER